MPPVILFQDIKEDIFWLDKHFEVYYYVAVLVDRFSNLIRTKPLKKIKQRSGYENFGAYSIFRLVSKYIY